MFLKWLSHGGFVITVKTDSSLPDILRLLTVHNPQQIKLYRSWVEFRSFGLQKKDLRTKLLVHRRRFC